MLLCNYFFLHDCSDNKLLWHTKQVNKEVVLNPEDWSNLKLCYFNWNSWSQWSDCPSPCGSQQKMQNRTRTCSGKDPIITVSTDRCEGDDIEKRQCPECCEYEDIRVLNYDLRLKATSKEACYDRCASQQGCTSSTWVDNEESSFNCWLFKHPIPQEDVTFKRSGFSTKFCELTGRH